jgi:diguanylate cyclase (GGDEF)-like protein
VSLSRCLPVPSAPLDEDQQTDAGGPTPPAPAPASRRASRNPLLQMRITARLVLGFLLPALLASLALAGVGLQSQRLLAQESLFYQQFLQSNTTLATAKDYLQLIHPKLQEMLAVVAQPQPSRETINDDQATVQGLALSVTTILETYRGRDTLSQHPDVSALFTQAGHGNQIAQQQALAQSALLAWRSYQQAVQEVMRAVAAGNSNGAHDASITLAEPGYSDALSALDSLIQFDGLLVPTIPDATGLEVNRLLLTTLLVGLGVSLGIGVFGWLISSTLVRRLRSIRAVVQSVGRGQLDARLPVVGRDELADVSDAVNGMLDTLVNAQEIERLHQHMQVQHEALTQANARLEALATTDMLTGLPNHRALAGLLEQEGERARRFGRPLSLLYFDGDRFKQVNDTYGHAAGDAVLRELGERASSVLRAGDTVGRFGGEEFLVLLPETGGQEALLVAERLRGAVAAGPLAAREVEGGIALTVSIGVASFPTDGATANEVREQADQAMYWAKRLGRNQVRTAEEAARANRDAALKATTAHMLERRELAALDGADLEQQVRSEQLGLIYSLMGALDLREPGMSAHAHEVSDLVAGMARVLHFDEARALGAATAAFLHDIGKIALPDRLLQQPRHSFSSQEWRSLRQHAELGAGIVEASPWLADLAPAIRHHHERWDGRGGPDGLRGEAIPLEARLIALAEAYHSMISERPYQAARSAADALNELERCAGTQFDPKLLPAFRVVLAQWQAGSSPSQGRSERDLLPSLP